MSSAVPGSSGDTPVRSLHWLVLVGVAGGTTLVVELAAVRLLAPWFGASTGVWTNVIGVILLALSLGYLVGGRLAEGTRPERSLGLVLALAGVLAAALPGLAAPVAGLFLPAGLSLQQAAGLGLWGSLAASALLFFPPAALLGCVGPLAVEILQVRRGGHAGRAGGSVLCASTLGSLAGTFATTHVFVPRFGLNATFLASGVLLFAMGAATLLAARGARSAPALGLFALAALVTGSRLERPAPAEGLTLIEERESPYQFVRVVRDTTQEREFKLLQVNEALDSFQSVWSEEPGLLGPGYYYDLFALPAWLDRTPERARWKVLVLGLGAGTTFRVLEGASPADLELELVGVEIDRDIVALGERHFDLPRADAGTRVIAGADARLALRLLGRDFDLIVLDAYAHQAEIPAHLCTVEFFDEVRAHLAPGGWFAVNAGGFGADDPVVAALGATLARGFGECLALRVPQARNWVLLTRHGAALPPAGELGAASGEAWQFEHELPRALVRPLTLPGSLARFADDPDAPVLRDDHNPMEHLQRRSLEEGRARLAHGS